MPTKTFFNLTREKRARIMKAAKKEFSRVPLEKAVIANIANDAGIPRGSFYQYFEDVNDLFIYLLEYVYGINKKKFTKYLEQTDYNLTEALKIKFANEIDHLTNEVNKQFKINSFMILFDEANPQKSKMAPLVIEKQNQIDLKFFPAEYHNKENFSQFAGICEIIGNYCTQKFLATKAKEEDIKDMYNNCIDFVKKGYEV